jgi:glutamyl-tRNA synthetase
MYRGRFAPSPTGELHLGSAATAVFAAARALQMRGVLVMRLEDLDVPRVVPGAAAALLDDLHWLGISWAEGPDLGGPTVPYTQSERHLLYEAAVEDLARRRLTYLCDCSRAEIASAASAPHAGEEGPRYPGTCRPHGMTQRSFRRSPALRLAVPAASLITIDDAVLGTWSEDVAQTTGDFVLRRGDGTFAYQLAVVVDDLAMGITEVVRASDLASSAPRQALLARLLGGSAPRFAHVPLVVDGGGRLSKRARGVPIAEQRRSGRGAIELVRAIASAYGHEVGDRSDPIAALAECLDLRRLGVAPVHVSRLM